MLKELFASTIFSVGLAHAGTEFSILTSEEPPTNYTEDGKTMGMTIDILNDLKKRIQDTTVVEVQPWARAYQTSKEKPNVMIFTMAKTPERVELGYTFLGPLMFRKHLFYKLRGSSLSVSSLDDIKQKAVDVGAMRGDWRSKALEDANIKVDLVVTHDINIKKLAAGRIPLMILSDLEIGMNAKKAGVNVDLLEPALLLKEGPSFIALSKGTAPEVVAKWQKAYDDYMKSDVPNKLAIKWGGILGTPMSFSAEKGIYVK